MAGTTQDLTQFVDKKVVVVKNAEDGTSVEVEGTVQSGNELGLVIKPKGKTNFDIIQASDIEEVRLVESAQKSLTRRTLKPVKLEQARNHLLERHAYTLAQVNKMSDQQALDAHEGIDHEASDLGHVHGDKNDTERAQAVEAEAEGS